MGGVCVPRRFLIYLYWITRRIVTIVIKITSTKDVIPANKVSPTTIRIRYGNIIMDAATKIVIFSSWKRLKNTTTCLPSDTSERNPRTLNKTKHHMDRTPYIRTSFQILNQPKEFVNKFLLTREAARSHHKPSALELARGEMNRGISASATPGLSAGGANMLVLTEMISPSKINVSRPAINRIYRSRMRFIRFDVVSESGRSF